MRIMGYNIYDGGVGRIDPIAEVIRQAAPDLVILPEACDRAEFEKLAGRLGMDSFLATHPHKPDHGSVGLLARHPIREVVNLTPLDSRLTRAALQATIISKDGQPFTVIGLHLHARETFADEAIRINEVAAIMEFARPLRDRQVAFALVGDFNAHHPDQIVDIPRTRPKTRKRLAGQDNQLPRQVIQTLLDAGYLDAHALLYAPDQFQISLGGDPTAGVTGGGGADGSGGGLRVDYVLVPPYLRSNVVRCDYPRGGLARFASDHFPVVADLNY